MRNGGEGGKPGSPAQAGASALKPGWHWHTKLPGVLTHTFPNSGRHCCSKTHSSISVEDKEDHKHCYRRLLVAHTPPPNGALRSHTNTVDAALTYTTLSIASHYVSRWAGAGEGAGAVSAKGIILTGLQARNCSQGTLVYICIIKQNPRNLFFFFKYTMFFSV